MPPPSARVHSGAGVARLWGLSWRMSLVIVLGFATLSVVWAQVFDSPEVAGPLTTVDKLIFLDLMLGVLAVVLYPLRRRWPLPIVVGIVALASASSFAVGAVMLAMISIATRRRRIEIVIVSLVFVSSSLVAEATFPTLPGSELDSVPWWQSVLLVIVLNATLVLTGLYIGGRRQLMAVLRDRADRIQREHDVRVEAAAMAERTRIARDMHDALAHRLSLVALHAGVLEYRVDLSPEQVRTAAGIVRENAHLAASDLREVLGVLRDPLLAETTGITRAPTSTIGAMELLMKQSRAAGNPTSLSVDDVVVNHLDSLSAGTRGHLLRVVQEGLTNVRKHAPQGPVEICLAGSPGHRVTVSLTNALTARAPEPPPAASGFGLVGLRERTQIAGGGLDVRQVDGRFVLQAWLPWPT